MTVSELRYLITANELNEGGNGARMSAMAKRLSVTKVSVCNAVERLIANGYFYHNGKRVLLTEKCLSEIADYLVVIDFIGDKLQRHLGTPKDRAFDEALGAACALGEESRKGVLMFARANKV